MLDLYLVNSFIDLWFAEDIGHGDITSLTMIDAEATGAIAETGVDFISSSKMIPGSPAVDIGLDEA